MLLHDSFSRIVATLRWRDRLTEACDPSRSASGVSGAIQFTFVLGPASEQYASLAPGAPSPGGSPIRREPVGDVQLAEMLSRLVELWETTPVRERAGLALAVTSAGGCSRSPLQSPSSPAIESSVPIRDSLT